MLNQVASAISDNGTNIFYSYPCIGLGDNFFLIKRLGSTKRHSEIIISVWHPVRNNWKPLLSECMSLIDRELNWRFKLNLLTFIAFLPFNWHQFVRNLLNHIIQKIQKIKTQNKKKKYCKNRCMTTTIKLIQNEIKNCESSPSLGVP